MNTGSIIAVVTSVLFVVSEVLGSVSAIKPNSVCMLVIMIPIACCRRRARGLKEDEADTPDINVPAALPTITVEHGTMPRRPSSISRV